ncbi:hypothetical protein HK101_010749 [Irineochytrium annulatum]|nr:hypothetical protein HK101_010749 [Irineochytrium annulatum]
MKAYEYSGSSAATIPTPKLEPHATPPPTAFGMVHPSYAAARRVPNFLLATSSRNSVAAREPLQAPALPQFDGLLVTKPVKINFNEEGTFRGPDPGTVAEIARGAARLRSIHHAFSTMRRSRREVMMDVVMMGGQQGGAEYPALQVQPEASLRYIDSAGEARTVGVLDAGGIMTMVDDGAAYGYDDGRGSVSGRSNVAEFYSELGEEREMDGAVVPPLFPSWGKPDWSGRRRKEAHVKKEERAVVAVSRAATKVASPLAVGVDEGRMSPWAPWVQPVPALMGRR